MRDDYTTLLESFDDICKRNPGRPGLHAMAEAIDAIRDAEVSFGLDDKAAMAAAYSLAHKKANEANDASRFAWGGLAARVVAYAFASRRAHGV